MFNNFDPKEGQQETQDTAAENVNAEAAADETQAESKEEKAG